MLVKNHNLYAPGSKITPSFVNFILKVLAFLGGIVCSR